MLNDKKSSILYILEILQKYTDKDHSLNYSQIREKLSDLYDITLERKTIARDIDILIEKGYDIIKRGNYGVHLGCREFEEGELLFLTDAIYSSRSMPTRYAKELVDKLTRDYSIYEKKKYKYLEKIDDGSRASNRQLFYTIEVLNEAIEQGKKVEFQYNSYGLDKKLSPKKDGKKYIINPYYMVNNHGKYYLVCNYDKYDNLANYKIECISNIKIVDDPVRPVKSLPGQEHFSIKNYMQEHIYMVAGKTIFAKIKVDNEERVNDIISWFGDKITLSKTENGIFADLSVNEDSLIYWALQYGDHVEIVAPKETREKMIDTLNRMIEKYR